MTVVIPADFRKAEKEYYFRVALQPRHELGYYLTDIEAFLPPEGYNQLLEWLWGQTMGLTDEDESIVYTQDFNRWYEYYRFSGGYAPIYD